MKKSFLLTMLMSALMAGVSLGATTFEMNWDNLYYGENEDQINAVPDIYNGGTVTVGGTRAPIAGTPENPRGVYGTTGYFCGYATGFQYDALDNVSRGAATIELYAERNWNENTGNYARLFDLRFGDNDYISLYMNPTNTAQGLQVRCWSKFWSNPENITQSYDVGSFPTGGGFDGNWNHFLVSYNIGLGDVSYQDRWIGLWVNGQLITKLTQISRWNVDQTGVNKFTIGSTSTFGANNSANSNLDNIRVSDVTVYDLYDVDANGNFVIPEPATIGLFLIGMGLCNRRRG